MAYTTTEFIANVKTRGSIPTSQVTYTEAKILSLGDDEIRTYINPMLIKSREYYLSYDIDTTVNSTGIYDISSRAVGSNIINAALLDGTSRLDLAWLTEDELQNTDKPPFGIPGGYLKRNQFIIKPATDHGYSTLRLTINLRQGNMVATTSAAQITAINTGTNTLTFTSLPSTFTTAQTYDIIQANPHFDTLNIDLTCSSVTSTTMVMSSLSSRLAVGDWVSLANYTPIPQIPYDLAPLLEQKVSCSILRTLDDIEGYKLAMEELARMEKAVTPIYTPRFENEGKKITLRNRLLRRI